MFIQETEMHFRLYLKSGAENQGLIESLVKEILLTDNQFSFTRLFTIEWNNEMYFI